MQLQQLLSLFFITIFWCNIADMKSIGTRITFARQKKNLTRQELANLLNITLTSVIRWEDEESEPRGHRLENLSKALDVSRNWLLIGGDTEEPESHLSSILPTETMGSRIAFARQKKSLSRSKLAGLLDISSTTIWQWEEQRTQPRGHRLESLAKALAVNQDWLLTGDAAGGFEQVTEQQYPEPEPVALNPEEPAFLNGNTPLFGLSKDFNQWYKTVDFDEFVAVKFYPNIKASAGFGAFNEEGKPPLAMCFRRYFIENTLAKNPAHLVAIMVSGESMYPTLKNGDTMLIDISRGWQGDGIYLIRIGTDLLVKRLKKSINHQLSIISDNATWGTETFDLRQVDDSEFAVLGKHLWHGSSAI